MTLLVIRLRAADIQEVEAAYTKRRDLRASYGCTSSRLLVDRHDPNLALALMEFPSFEAAKKYTASLLGNSTLPAMSDLSAEFYEDALSADAVDGFFTARLFRRTGVSPIVS